METDGGGNHEREPYSRDLARETIHLKRARPSKYYTKGNNFQEPGAGKPHGWSSVKRINC